MCGTDRDTEVCSSKSVSAPAVSAQNPSKGFSLVIFCPIVFTILQPPKSVPSAIAAWHDRITHIGGLEASLEETPYTIRAIHIIPMDFWASLPPCPRLKAAADKS